MQFSHQAAAICLVLMLSVTAMPSQPTFQESENSETPLVANFQLGDTVTRKEFSAFKQTCETVEPLIITIENTEVEDYDVDLRVIQTVINRIDGISTPTILKDSAFTSMAGSTDEFQLLVPTSSGFTDVIISTPIGSTASRTVMSTCEAAQEVGEMLLTLREKLLEDIDEPCLDCPAPDVPACETIAGLLLYSQFNAKANDCELTGTIPLDEIHAICNNGSSSTNFDGVGTITFGDCVDLALQSVNCIASTGLAIASQAPAAVTSEVTLTLAAAYAQVATAASALTTLPQGFATGGQDYEPSMAQNCGGSASCEEGTVGCESPCEACPSVGSFIENVDNQRASANGVVSDVSTGNLGKIPLLGQSSAAAGGRVGIEFIPPGVDEGQVEQTRQFESFASVGTISIDTADKGSFEQDASVIEGHLHVKDDLSKKAEGLNAAWGECLGTSVVGAVIGVAVIGGGPAGFVVGAGASSIACGGLIVFKAFKGVYNGYITCGYYPSGVAFGAQDAVSDLGDLVPGNVAILTLTSDSPTISTYYYDDDGNVVDEGNVYIPVLVKSRNYDEGRNVCEAAHEASLGHANANSNFYGTVIGNGTTDLTLIIDLVPTLPTDLVAIADGVFISPVQGLTVGCDSSSGCPTEIGLSIEQCGEVQLISEGKEVATYSFVGNTLKNCTTVEFWAGPLSGSLGVPAPLALTLEYEAAVGTA
jgi:hypothetical protein